MKLFIPELGTQLKLTEDWTFDLHAEHRNATVGQMNGYKLEYIPQRFPEWKGGQPYPIYVPGMHDWWVKEGVENTHIIPVTLPVGTILKVDRIYIRKGAKDFSSISFFISGAPKVTTQKNQYRNAVTRPVRFWAKLSDCNTIEFEHHV